LPHWTNNHPRPQLNVVINPYESALLPTVSIDKAFLIILMPHWTNNHPRPQLNVVINPYESALLPTVSIDKAFLIILMQFSITKMIKRRQNSITVYQIYRSGYHFRHH